MKIKFSNDKNTLITALIITAGLCIICTISLLKYIIKTYNFEQVSATVTNIETFYGQSNQDNLNRNRYICYSFVYNKRKYNAYKLTIFSLTHQIGEQKIIKINPQNPMEVKNELFIKIYILIIIMCMLIFIAIVKHLIKG